MQPRPMVAQRRLQLVRGGEHLLRSSSKPLRNGVSFDVGFGGGVGRRRSRGFHESSGCQKSKDLVVIFAFLEVLSVSRGGTAVFRIPVWVTCMCTRPCTFP